MKRNYNNNYRGGYRKPKEDVFVKKMYINIKFSEKVEKSEEDGFVGKPSEWFSDEEFYKNIIASAEDGKKDYYFNSYSSFYIHEEMIKDRVTSSNF
jgi:protein associated with RNAse G/E